MGMSISCHCDERAKHPARRAWGVAQRRCNHSAFNGYRWTPSEYSDVVCLKCGGHGRTRADYTAILPDAEPCAIDKEHPAGWRVVPNVSVEARLCQCTILYQCASSLLFTERLHSHFFQKRAFEK